MFRTRHRHHPLPPTDFEELPILTAAGVDFPRPRWLEFPLPSCDSRPLAPPPVKKIPYDGVTVDGVVSFVPSEWIRTPIFQTVRSTSTLVTGRQLSSWTSSESVHENPAVDDPNYK